MAWSFKQINQSGNVGGTTTPTLAAASAQTAGDKNIVLVAWFDAAHTNTVSVKDSVNGSVYSIVGSRFNDTSGINADFAIFETTSAIAAAGAGVNIITVTFGSAPGFAQIVVSEYAGLKASAAGSGEAGAQTGPAPAAGPAVVNISAVASGDLILAMGPSIGSGANPTATVGGTQRGSFLDNGSLVDFLATGSGAHSIGWTFAAGSDNWNIIGAAFAQAPTGIAVPFTVVP